MLYSIMQARGHKTLECDCAPLREVVIFGGGRWSRVIAKELCGLVHEDTRLTACSPSGSASWKSWLKEQGLEDRIRIVDKRPERLPGGPVAVVVANAARDHASVARWAVEHGAAVLVEKPFALSLTEAESLAECASQNGGLLASAHVFRFARYLSNFARILPSWSKIKSVNLEWTDPLNERRHGESKSFDSSVPIFVDCLPHAVSVLQSVFGKLPRVLGDVSIEGGGSKMTLSLVLENCPCLVVMQRNAPNRLRRLTIETSDGAATLDFSVEPGNMRFADSEICADSAWSKRPGPLSMLLSAFLTAAAGRAADPRLGLETAYAACEIADSVKQGYQDAVLNHLLLELTSSRGDISQSCAYSLSEVLQESGRLSDSELRNHINQLLTTVRSNPISKLQKHELVGLLYKRTPQP